MAFRLHFCVYICTNSYCCPLSHWLETMHTLKDVANTLNASVLAVTVVGVNYVFLL